MSDTVQSVLIGGLSGVVSAALTYVSTKAKTRLDLAAQYDKELQQSRLAAYKILWAMTEPLARYGRARTVSVGDVHKISEQTRDWYFQTGGIYLTQASRGPYFKWKALLQPVLELPEIDTHLDAPVPEEQLAMIVAAASLLRTALSDDIRTKRLSLV